MKRVHDEECGACEQVERAKNTVKKIADPRLTWYPSEGREGGKKMKKKMSSRSNIVCLVLRKVQETRRVELRLT